MNALFFAIQFLTRIPVPFKYQVNDDTQKQAFYWYSTVGLIIGITLWATHAISLWLFGDVPILIAAIVLTLWVLITGALHLDGLGDSADAWLGGYGNKEKTLAIMKDPTSGPAAIVWILLVLLLKFAALYTLIEQQLTVALILAPLMARMASMVLFICTPYVRESGLASPFANDIDKGRVYLQLFLVGAVVIYTTGLTGFGAIVLATLTFIFFRRMMMERIQGTTGDTAGALIEWVEAAALLGFLIKFSNGL